jgi:hypothetical protein
MKRLALIGILLLLLGFGFALSQYDSWLKARFRVADFQWKLTPDKPLALSETLAVEGINVALRANGHDPANWQAVPTWVDSPILRLSPLNPNGGDLTLSNRNSGAKLLASVELDPTNRTLNIAISRPK